MIQKYRKRPTVVEAVEWTGDNYDEVKSFVGKCLIGETMLGEDILELTITNDCGDWGYARFGDMIIKDEYGNFIVMNPEWFKKNYEKCYTVDEFKEKWNEENDE